jgi:hypothetical protein
VRALNANRYSRANRLQERRFARTLWNGHARFPHGFRGARGAKLTK